MKARTGEAAWSVVAGQPHGVTAIRGVIAGDILYTTCSNSQGPMNATAGTVWNYNIRSGTWTNITPTPAPPAQGGYSGISVYPKNPNYIIVSTLDCWYPKDEVYLSTDGGASWTGKLRNASLDYSYAPYTSTITPHWTACIAMDPLIQRKQCLEQDMAFGRVITCLPRRRPGTSKIGIWRRLRCSSSSVRLSQICFPLWETMTVSGSTTWTNRQRKGDGNPPKGTSYSIAFAGKSAVENR